ncbi:hypothetical protein SRHO_G00101370 [Serrasalmus rhombeus]
MYTCEGVLGREHLQACAGRSGASVHNLGSATAAPSSGGCQKSTRVSSLRLWSKCKSQIRAPSRIPTQSTTVPEHQTVFRAAESSRAPCASSDGDFNPVREKTAVILRPNGRCLHLKNGWWPITRNEA